MDDDAIGDFPVKKCYMWLVQRNEAQLDSKHINPKKIWNKYWPAKHLALLFGNSASFGLFLIQSMLPSNLGLTLNLNQEKPLSSRPSLQPFYGIYEKRGIIEPLTINLLKNLN
ncbi:hypothetical protein C5167_011761 [Papaver somniferum]|nr:hypothetical protein C5167_011761 [Papaver somniferum]